MMLIEETTVPDAGLPVEQLKAHLRLGTGFGEDSLQDGVLAGFLRAALAAIEGRTGKVLIARVFSWTISEWRDRGGAVLPAGPVSQIDDLVLIDRDGAETVWDPARYWLDADMQTSRVCPVSGLLPAVGPGGRIRVRFVAGMAPDWTGLPGDLAHAVVLLAAHYYEYRAVTKLSDGCMPFGVTSLIQRYRSLRLTPGAAL